MNNKNKDSNSGSGALASESTGRRWYLLIILIFGSMLNTVDKMIISVLIEPIKAEFGLSDTTLSLLAGMATMVPFALACIPIGMMADRVNRKKLLVFLMIAWSLLTGLAGLATTVMILFISRIGVGAFESGYSPLSLSMISDTFNHRKRSTVMGLYSLGAPAGAFIAFAVGGYAASVYGWRAAFFIAGVPGIVLALLIAMTIREPQRGRYDPVRTNHKSTTLPEVLRYIWSDRALFNILLGMVCCAVLPAALTVWTPSFLIRVHGMDIKQAGLASSIIVGLCGGAGAVAGGLIADRLGRHEEWRKLISPVIGTLLAIICAVMGFVITSNPIHAIIMLGLVACFAQFIIGTGYGLTTTLCPAMMRGTTLSILVVLLNLGSYGLGALLLGLLSDALHGWVGDGAIAFALLGSLLFSVAGLYFVLKSMWHIRNRQEPALAPQLSAYQQ